jgi:hypothetical protein
MHGDKPVYVLFIKGCFNQSTLAMIVKERDSADRLSPRRPPPAAEVSAVAHRELLHRIVASPTFVRSERLCSLLLYVCDMTFKGRGDEINEQKIGQAVFGRSRDYDSTIDGIVRTQASRLRQRLEQYFSDEGAREAVQIVIPRGGYVPVFEPRTIKPPNIETESLNGSSVLPVLQPVRPPRTERFTSLQILPWALCLLLAAAVMVLALRGRDRPVTAQATSHPLWGHIFSADRPTLVVPADSGLVIYHDMSRRDFGLHEYLLGEYRNDQRGQNVFAATTSAKDWQANLASRRYTSIVDLDEILSLEQLASRAASKLQVRYARDLRPNDLKSGNVILIGASEANPWVELFERNMNFVFQDDYKTGVFSVVNRSPQPGEPARWDSVWNDPQRRVYGLVAYVPNLAGDGNALILEGTSMSGTEAARDFVMDDSQLLPFLKRTQRKDGSVPHFEVLLGTQNISASAVRSNLLAWRTTN